MNNWQVCGRGLSFWSKVKVVWAQQRVMMSQDLTIIMTSQATEPASKQAGQAKSCRLAISLTVTGTLSGLHCYIYNKYRLGLGLNYNIRPSVECLTLCFKNLNCLAKNIVIGVTVQAKCFCVGSYSRATDNSWTPSVHLTNAPVWLT